MGRRKKVSPWKEAADNYEAELLARSGQGGT